MALRDRVSIKVTKALIWRMCLWGLTACVLLTAIIVWVSGIYETKDAMDSSRRLLIRLDNGAIEGKQTSLEGESKAEDTTPPAPAATPAPAEVTVTPTTTFNTNAAAAPPADTPAPAEPAVAAIPAATPEPVAAEPVPSIANSSAVKPAAIPLAMVKDTLLEKSPVGPLPIIGPGGIKPWHAYAKPYARTGHLPMIAIIVTGLGQNKVVSDGAIKLPENVSLSFSPYAKDVVAWANAARVAGHEILIDLPLEPSNYPASDPGPYGLLAGKSKEENTARLQWLMSRVRGYVGFISPQNEVFSASDEAFKGLLESVSARGLMLALGHESAKTETKQILDASHVANVTGDMLLDEELSATAIKARLTSLEKLAGKRGYAVGIAQAFPLTIQQLSAWSAELEKSGFVLVPVTFITSLKFPS